MFLDKLFKLILKKERKEQFEEKLDKEIKKEELSFSIILLKEKNFYKMEISDYISIINYVDKMDVIDKMSIGDLVCNAVLWNSRKQKVNKGAYYVFHINNSIYNVFIGEEFIQIDERIKINDIIEEKYLFLNSSSFDYSFSLLRHDKTGSTFYTKYFNKSGVSLGKLSLSDIEFFETVSLLISNLEMLDNINDVINIDILKEYVLKDIKENKLEKIIN